MTSTGSPSPAGPTGPAGEPPGVEVAPAVVVVMVTHDPGDWWEFTLESVAEQTYPNVATFVVDTASAEDPTARLAAVLPEAHLLRLEHDPGFGPAANEVLSSVEGAAFYLLCHDDIVLDLDAVQTMVEEAYRSNAGVVGPKLVEWDDSDRLLQVGVGSDKFGAPAPLVDRGELDQEQHDAVRDVFYVPGAATLVRADLFAALGGFDPGIDLLGEDLDLCWRAHAAGARVLVAPAAKVAHKEALELRRDIADRRRLTYRHRLRTVMVNYGRFHRWRVLPQAFVLAFVEALSSLLLGRLGHARDVAGAWTDNLGHLGEIRRRRREVRAHRSVSDREIRRLQVRGSARLTAFLRGQLGANDDRLAGMAGAGRDLADSLRSPSSRLSLAAWAAVALLILVGSRGLLTHPIPAVGEFVPFDTGPVDLMKEFVSGYNAAGLGSATANPSGVGIVGILGTLFFGAMGQLRRVLILVCMPLGVLGMWRLARPIGSRRSRVVALVGYAVIPVAANSMANAGWSGLVMYALSPWIVNQLARASRLAPFGAVGDEAGPGVNDRPLTQRIVILGIMTALGGAFAPFVLPMVLGIAIAMALGGVLVGQLRGALRMLTTALGAVVLAAALNLPWSVEFWRPDWASMAGTVGIAPADLDASHILRFATGPAGDTALAWAYMVAGSLALLVGKRWRLAWATRGWMLALAGWGLVLASSKGYLAGYLPPPEVLLAPGAVGLALAAAMGMAAFEVDLGDYHLGWRQMASVIAGAAMVVAVVPVLTIAANGRWDLPEGDYVGPFLSQISSPAPYRSLWIGDATTVPGRSWPTGIDAISADGPGHRIVYGTTRAATPDVQNLWPGSDRGATEQIRGALGSAAAGQTSHLGALLAPMGIEYVIVPKRVAPPPSDVPETDPRALLDLLGAQLDLERIDMPTGLVAYRNTAWGPLTARLPRDTVISPGGPNPADRTIPALAGAPNALPSTGGYASASGPVAAPEIVYLASATDDRWQLVVNGVPQQRDDALGWANQYTVDATGQADLRYQTSKLRYAQLAGVALLWVLAGFSVWRTRVRKERVRDLDELREGGAL